MTNLDASPYVGRLALTRIQHGTIRKGQQIAWCRADGRIERAKVTELYVAEALDRVEADEAGPGEIVAVAGLPDVTIGETLADPDDPRPLPVSTVDEPSLSMTMGINTSPLAGREGDKLTASMLKGRLDQELVGNVSLRVLTTERPDTWEVQGRGELQLAVLVELMRREGFELTVGKPQVVTQIVDGKVHEPVERLAIDAPEDYVGVLTQLLALRKGRLEQMVNHGTGWVRLEYLVPARALIGFRTEFLTETRGTGILHHVFDRYEPWHGELRTRPDRQPRGRPPRPRHRLRADEPAGARLDVRRAGSRGLRGDDRRRERARRGSRRQPDEGEEADEHARGLFGRDRAPDPAPPDVARAGARVHSRGRVRRGDARKRPPAQARAGRVDATERRQQEGARPRRQRIGLESRTDSGKERSVRWCVSSETSCCAATSSSWRSPSSWASPSRRVVSAFVNGLITPLIALIFGEPDLSSLDFTINDAVFSYGSVLNALINFVAIAAAVFFFVVRPVNMLMTRFGSPVEEGMPDEERRHQELLAALRAR